MKFEEYDSKNVIVSVSMPLDLVLSLEKITKRLGSSRSGLIRFCIYRALPEFMKLKEILKRADEVEIDNEIRKIIGEA